MIVDSLRVWGTNVVAEARLGGMEAELGILGAKTYYKMRTVYIPLTFSGQRFL